MNQMGNGSVGPQMRARRMQLQLTLTELSKRSGLSIPFLSQLENRQTGISLESLHQLASALEVSLDFFFPDPNRSNPVRTPKQYRHFSLQGSKVAYAQIGSGDADCRLEPLLLVLPPESGDQVLNHQGEAFVMVLQGKLSLCLEGQKHVLGVGHTAHLRPGTPYTWRNDTHQEVRLSWVGTPKIF